MLFNCKIWGFCMLPRVVLICNWTSSNNILQMNCCSLFFWRRNLYFEYCKNKSTNIFLAIDNYIAIDRVKVFPYNTFRTSCTVSTEHKHSLLNFGPINCNMSSLYATRAGQKLLFLTFLNLSFQIKSLSGMFFLYIYYTVLVEPLVFALKLYHITKSF